MQMRKQFQFRAFPIVAATYRRHLCCSWTSPISCFCHVMWPTISSNWQERHPALHLCTQRHLKVICRSNEEVICFCNFQKYYKVKTVMLRHNSQKNNSFFGEHISEQRITLNIFTLYLYKIVLYGSLLIFGTFIQ